MIHDYTVEYHLDVDFNINHFGDSDRGEIRELANKLLRIRNSHILNIKIYPTHKNIILSNLPSRFFVCTNDVDTEYISQNNVNLVINTNNYIVNIDHEIIEQLENALLQIRAINKINNILLFSRSSTSNNYQSFYQKINVDFYKEDPFVYRTDEQIINFFNNMVDNNYFGIYKCTTEVINYFDNNLKNEYDKNKSLEDVYNYIDSYYTNNLYLKVERYDIVDNTSETEYKLSNDELKQLFYFTLNDNKVFKKNKIEGVIYKCILDEKLISDTTTTLLTTNENNNLVQSLFEQYKKYLKVYTVNDVRKLLYDIHKEYDILLQLIYEYDPNT